uniref:Putative WW-binding domain-containing protein n=1 Tax=Salvator merianae TaxID=96440 RepID=A0A8D0E0S6_SALMN
MAKRRAEALLAWRAPGCESFLFSPGPLPPPLPKRLRSDPERKEPAARSKKRKREGAAVGEDEQQPSPEEEEEEVNGKRRAVPVPKGSGLPKEAEELPGFLLEGPAAGRRLREDMGEEGPEIEKSSRLLRRRPPEVKKTKLVVLVVGEGGGEREHDVWHYNSFQYWRSPLPTIDLSDILDLEKDDPVETSNYGSVGFSEMET